MKQCVRLSMYSYYHILQAMVIEVVAYNISNNIDGLVTYLPKIICQMTLSVIYYKSTYVGLLDSV